MAYTRLPTPQEAEAAGFSLADYEEEVEVWPENWPAFELFNEMGTQWDSGMSGLTGLKYLVLFDLMDRHGLKGDEWWQMLRDIQACEAQALKAMSAEP